MFLTVSQDFTIYFSFFNRVNDRIISVNGISLQNVDYATAVQVLRDSGDTVLLVIKRRITQHQHSASYTAGVPLAALGINPLPPKVTLTKSSKKEGCVWHQKNCETIIILLQILV